MSYYSNAEEALRPPRWRPPTPEAAARMAAEEAARLAAAKAEDERVRAKAASVRAAFDELPALAADAGIEVEDFDPGSGRCEWVAAAEFLRRHAGHAWRLVGDEVKMAPSGFGLRTRFRGTALLLKPV